MTEKIYEALQKAESLLKNKGLEINGARWLMEEASGKSGASLLADLREPVQPDVSAQFWKWIDQLLTGKPVQYIIGKQDFYGRTFRVDENVLIPRPETEELVEGVLQIIPQLFADRPVTIADIGTGSGAIAITIKKEWPSARVAATDISGASLAVAAQNAVNLQANIEFLEGNMAKPISHEKWDIIISNPPYIAQEEAIHMSQTVTEFEPHGALFAEEDGLYFYKQLAAELPDLMNRPGLIALEIGYLQGPAVRKLFTSAFPEAEVEIIKDIHGKDRMIFCKICE